MQIFTIVLSLLLTLVVAQDTKSTRTVTSTLTSTWISTCTVMYATTPVAPQPSAAVIGYPLTNGTVATTTPVPTAQFTNPAGPTGTGTGVVSKPSSTNVPYRGAGAASSPQALFALAAGLVVLVSTA